MLPCIAGHVGADCRRHDPVRAAGPVAATDADCGCGHECGDRAGQSPAPAGLLQPHGTCIRGCADQLRPARRSRGDRAGAHRSGDARSALQGHRLATCGPTNRASRKRRRAPASPASAAPASSRSSRRCTSPESSTSDGVIDGSLAARSPRIVEAEAHLLLHLCRAGGADAAADHAKRRACDPAGEVRAVRGRQLLMDHLHRRRSTASAWPVLSAATST